MKWVLLGVGAIFVVASFRGYVAWLGGGSPRWFDLFSIFLLLAVMFGFAAYGTASGMPEYTEALPEVFKASWGRGLISCGLFVLAALCTLVCVLCFRNRKRIGP